MVATAAFATNRGVAFVKRRPYGSACRIAVLVPSLAGLRRHDAAILGETCLAVSTLFLLPYCRF
jgi:hypothetical protein